MIKVSTFCSGIGAAEQAFKNLDVPHEVVFACEIDKYARMSYEANHSAETMYEDMTQHDYVDSKYYSDINISGIPCQAFSLAGLRKGENDSRGLLFYDFYRYVKNQQPKIFIIENVKGLLSADKGVIFQNWIELLGRSVNGHEKMFLHEDSLEYNLHHTVLNSKNFGVPQNRERVFIVGIRKDLPNDFSFPIGWKLDKRLRDVLEPEVDEKYYLSNNSISRLTNNNQGYHSDIKDESDIASTILASDYKLARGMNVLKVKEATKQGFAIEPFCVAMRGMNPENKNDRTAGAKTEQRLEANNQGITNTITSVQKDNLIIEPQLNKIGQLDGYESDGRIYDSNGISPTIDTCCNKRPLFTESLPQLNQVAQIDGFESEGRVYDANGIARTIKDGGGGGAKTGWYKVDEDWVVGGLQKNQTPRTDGICPALTSAMGMGGGQTPIVKVYDQIKVIANLEGKNESNNRVYSTEGISPTILAGNNGGGQSPVKHLTHDSRIRRLTPLECFRLQAFSDDFFYKCKKVNSDSQLYKKAGNSITVTVLESIIKNLLHLLQ